MEVLESYKLFFNWRGIKYTKSIASFKKAWLEGPVLVQAAKIESSDFIDLDFTVQNHKTSIFLPNNFFIARLSWKDVEYRDNIVVLKRCTLQHNKSGSLRELKDSFRFLIDCSQHEEHLHRNMLVYPAWVLNPEEIIK